MIDLKRLWKSNNKLELFIIGYLVVSIILHITYNQFLSDKLYFDSFYNDHILYTIANLFVLLVELLNYILIKFVDIQYDGFTFILNGLTDLVNFINNTLYNNKYAAFILNKMDWGVVYVVTVIIIVVKIIKKTFRLAISITVVLFILYIIYSYVSAVFLVNKYQAIDYISSERFDIANVVEVELVEVVDGDTIKVKDGNEVFTVRLLYVDTPEYTKEIEEYGFEATQMLKTIINDGDKLYLEYDGSKYDKYERVLAWVWTDDILTQEILVKNGLVEDFYDYGDYKYEDIMHSAMYYAKEEKLNIYEEE